MSTDGATQKAATTRRMEWQALLVSAFFIAVLSLVQAFQEPEPAGRMLLTLFCTVAAAVWGSYVIPVLRRLGFSEQVTLVPLLIYLAFPFVLAVISITLMSPYVGEALGIYLCCSGVRLFGLQLRDLVPVVRREWVWVSAVACVYAGFLLIFVFSERIFGYVFWRIVLRLMGSEMCG